MNARMEHARHSRKVTATARWRVLRAAILERDNYACRTCGARGRLEVDHVKPVRSHPALAWTPANLQALCPGCHARKTRLEVGHPDVPEERKDWLQLVAALERPDRNPERNSNA